jgi:hypothetical protein
MSRAIAILGTHRSGTSLVTRLLNLLGAYLGEETSLMAPAEDNPSGYWERKDVYDLHERVLDALSESWDTSLPLPEGWHTAHAIQPFRKELRGLIQRVFGDRGLWAWKDPRTSLLLPLWKDVLADLRIELRAVLVLRNPLEVAKSLERRNGFSRDESYGIWLNYNLAMLDETRGLRRSLISYDAVMASWQTSMRRCMKEIGLPWPRLTPSLRSDLKETVRPDQRHATASAPDLETGGCPLPVIELYQILNQVARKGKLSQSLDERAFRRLLASHRAFSDLHRGALHRRSRSRQERQQGPAEVRLAELRSQIAFRDGRIQDLERLAESYQTRLQDANSWFEQLERTRQDLIAELRVRLDLSQQQVAERNTEAAEIRRQLELRDRALTEKEAAVQRFSQQPGERDSDSETEDQRARRTAETELKTTLEKLKGKSERIRALEELVREREKISHVTLAAATSRNQALETLVTQVLASRSWRMTEPLRRAMMSLREIRGRLRSQTTHARSPGVASEPKG